MWPPNAAAIASVQEAIERMKDIQAQVDMLLQQMEILRSLNAPESVLKSAQQALVDNQAKLRDVQRKAKVG